MYTQTPQHSLLPIDPVGGRAVTLQQAGCSTVCTAAVVFSDCAPSIKCTIFVNLETVWIFKHETILIFPDKIVVYVKKNGRQHNTHTRILSDAQYTAR